ncbi:MAG TPA: cell division protein FtsL [Castellaniella sp.]|uniref:cell division protein FtsL n=1 Tax=Castellaniella sp. TaxID=1955812 RepID=UPI002EE5E16A
MMRLAVLLTVMLMASAISLVTVRFQTRELFVASERLKSQAHELDIEWRRLQLQRAELARNARIDELARTELHLVPVTPGRTIYLQEPPLSPQVSSQGGQP